MGDWLHDSKDYQCLYKIAWHLQLTYAWLPIYFESSLGDIEYQTQHKYIQVVVMLYFRA